MKAAPTLLCIPDISGFTQFMSESDFELSSKVIPSLLNKIVYSNKIGLKISEIEGDAVLFYKNGELPSLAQIVDQCKFFYTEFYRQIHALTARYEKQEDAAVIPEMLGLKIILHFGKEVGLVPVGKLIKLIGEDVITAHRLLKNDIDLEEYILISEDLMSQYDKKTINGNFDWSKVVKGHMELEHIGKVNYHYINLSTLEK